MMNRRTAISHLATSLALSVLASTTGAQVPRPPPPNRGRGYRSSFLPTATDVMYSLRAKVTIDKDDAQTLERLLVANLSKQRGVLRRFGVDVDYELPPSFRLTRRDADDLNDELDDLMDSLEVESRGVLSGRARSAFRQLLESASSRRRTAINSLKR